MRKTMHNTFRTTTNKTPWYQVCLLTLGGIISNHAVADEVLPTDEQPVEHIIVTASRTPQNVDQVMASVEVITRDEIDKLQPKSLADLLATVAGLDVARQGGAGQQTSLFTRGTGSDQTLILIDGVRSGSATLGNKAIENLPMAQIERVEVVKGPRASMWGSDAIGGVINIFTRRMSAGEYQLGAETGSDSYVSGDGQIGVGYDAGTTTISLSAEDSRGFDAREDTEFDDDGYDRLSAAIRGDYRVNEQIVVDWIGQVDDGSNDYDNSYGANKNDYDNYLWQLRGNYQTEQWLSTFAFSQTRDYNKNYGNGIAKGDGDFFETRRKQVSWVNHYQLYNPFTVSAGVDFYREDINANTDYEEDSRDVSAIFGNALFQDQKWIAEAAIRYDDVENIDSETTYNASIGYNVTDKLLVALNAGHSFKAPTFNDLYYPESFGSKGNPDLTSETADSYELLLRSSYAGIKVTASLYYTEIDDLIEWVCDEFWNCSPENINEVKITGGESTVNFSTAGLDHRATLSYVDAEDQATGSQLIRRARKTASYQVSYDWQDFELLGQYEYHGERSDAGQRLDDYQLVNIALAYYVTPSWTIRAKANNLFDETYQNVLGYNTPGSEYFVGVSYRGFSL
ncbi:TonB-dependent receptor [Corallincola holothuriorum]|uniref:TonB-dependent receptor n=2 Tax=Corallincola holothuriorum TaxID=2282215 RepID=A0A368NN00_9GAMM|nr:TonB-dependent receptor [Corallincola holothuriorum]